MGRRSQALHRGFVDFLDRLAGIPRATAMVKDNTALPAAAAEQARHTAEESRQRTDQIRRSREETDRALEGAIGRLRAEVSRPSWRGNKYTQDVSRRSFDQAIDLAQRCHRLLARVEAERDQAVELLRESCNSLELMRKPGAAWDDCMARVATARTFLAQYDAAQPTIDPSHEDDEGYPFFGRDGHPVIPEGWIKAVDFPKGKYIIIETDVGWDLYHEDDHGAFS